MKPLRSEADASAHRRPRVRSPHPPTRGGTSELYVSREFSAQERRKPACAPEAVAATSGGFVLVRELRGPEIVFEVVGASPCPVVLALVLTATSPFFHPRGGSTK